MKVGVLALQGGVEEHVNHICKLGHEPILIKKEEDLKDIDRLILPGGESTTIGKLLRITGLMEPMRKKIQEGLKTWGTCAGMILLAKNIVGGEPIHLGVLDISVMRNGFGAQIDSFKSKVIIEEIDNKELELVFIRAPYVEEVGENVEILAKVQDKIVAAKKENILVTSFHPELTEDTRVLEYFLKM